MHSWGLRRMIIHPGTATLRLHDQVGMLDPLPRPALSARHIECRRTNRSLSASGNPLMLLIEPWILHISPRRAPQAVRPKRSPPITHPYEKWLPSFEYIFAAMWSAAASGMGHMSGTGAGGGASNIGNSSNSHTLSLDSAPTDQNWFAALVARLAHDQVEKFKLSMLRLGSHINIGPTPPIDERDAKPNGIMTLSVRICVGGTVSLFSFSTMGVRFHESRF